MPRGRGARLSTGELSCWRSVCGGSAAASCASLVCCGTDCSSSACLSSAAFACAALGCGCCCRGSVVVFWGRGHGCGGKGCGGAAASPFCFCSGCSSCACPGSAASVCASLGCGCGCGSQVASSGFAGGCTEGSGCGGAAAIADCCCSGARGSEALWRCTIANSPLLATVSTKLASSSPDSSMGSESRSGASSFTSRCSRPRLDFHLGAKDGRHQARAIAAHCSPEAVEEGTTF